MRSDQPSLYCPWCRRTSEAGRIPCSALPEQDRGKLAATTVDEACRQEMRKRPLFPRSLRPITC